MKISIALTTYNGRKYIIELLDSLRNQTRKPDEVIIADDMSEDDTVELINGYIKEYDLNNWIVIRNRVKLGWKKNFRNAMQLCTGDIIMFCDQDDIWHHDKIEVVCNIFSNNPCVQVLISNYVLLLQGSKQSKGHKGSMRDDGRLEKIKGWDKLGTIARPGCTQAFTRRLAEIMTNYDNLDCAHDHIMYNLGLITDTLYIINLQLIDFRRHAANASAYKIRFGRERKAIEAEERLKVCEVLMKYSEDVANQKAYETAKIRRDFYFGRKAIFDDGNIFKMIRFVCSHYIQYGSMRDRAVDLIAMMR